MRILRMLEVVSTTGLSRSTIYRRVNAGSFPGPIALGEASTGWLEHEILEWVSARIAERDQADAAA